jgi:DNA-directed RNA polymerase specialized sigma24 family protein
VSLPPTISEADLLAVVEQVVRALSQKYGFLFGSTDDFRQQVVVWSLEALAKFDPGAGTLSGYLFRNSRNRCLNAFRDLRSRNDFPCAACHDGRPCGENGAPCPAYEAWAKRNRTKANLHQPLPIEVAVEQEEGAGRTTSSVEDDLVEKELRERIDAELPLDLRADYLRMLAGAPVDSDRRRRVRRAVADILGA